jgi:Protein of unknown function (DUF1549)/Planctomycete cytochrome C
MIGSRRPEAGLIFRIKIFAVTMPIRHKAGPAIKQTFRWLFCTALGVCSVLDLTRATAAAPADDSTKPKSVTTTVHPKFDRDIRPIVAENCYPCHGPDQNKRKAKLRLDQKDDALKALPNGDFAIVPGDPLKSQLVVRISSTDSDEVMPPVKSGKKLTSEQIKSLTQWITEGASWQSHWSFTTPTHPALPAVKNKRWVRNPIDTFILARLESEGLTPTAEAVTNILLRRVSLDLVGLPPTPEQLLGWSRQPDPFSSAVDDLLASPHCGERMASDWLD